MVLNFIGDIKVDDGERICLCPSLSKELDNASFNIANLEAPIICANSNRLTKSGPNLYHNKNILALIQKCHLKLISLANNHMMDFGKESLLYTKNLLSAFCGLAGAGTWDEAYKLYNIDIENEKLGFLAITQHEFGVLDDETLIKGSVGTALMSHPCVDELILEGKKKCDYLFILPHAGVENEFYPLPEIRTLYRHWIRMGADGVFASHPHTPQGWEMYKSKPICYSLGNFCFENHSPSLPPYWFYGLMAQVHIKKGVVALNVKYVKFNQDKNELAFTDDDKLCRHINEINSVLKDESMYLKKVNGYCNRLAEYYDLAFAKGGYYKYGTKKFAVQLVKQFAGTRYKGNLNHALNNIRCEAHRWAIIRAWNNKIKQGDVFI